MTTPEQRLAIVRIVAENWRYEAGDNIWGYYAGVADLADNILLALDGEVDPTRLLMQSGSDSDAERIRAIVAETCRYCAETIFPYDEGVDHDTVSGYWWHIDCVPKGPGPAIRGHFYGSLRDRHREGGAKG